MQDTSSKKPYCKAPKSISKLNFTLAIVLPQLHNLAKL